MIRKESEMGRYSTTACNRDAHEAVRGKNIVLTGTDWLEADKEEVTVDGSVVVVETCES
jgi:hypothetical protein